ncbi:cation transporter, partial [Actinocorallia lasiicapitis]
MTCASCAHRIERKLNKLDGVSASVNYATETATVRYDETQATPQDLIATIESAGYGATLPQEQAEAETEAVRERSDPLRTRLLWAAALTVPVLALSMIPALQFDRWQWLALQLATPVVLWAGWPFHRAAWINLRHGAATMDTLVSVGALAAWGWSVLALFFGDAGMPGMKMGFSLVPSRSGGVEEIYLEVAAVVVTAVLGGRYFEHRARGRAGSALRALLELGAKDVAVLRDGVEQRIPVDRLAVGDRFVVRPGEKIATDG